VTNISRRFAERGDGGDGGSTGPGSPLIDLVNNRLTFKFILPIGWIDILANFLQAPGLHLRHGYRTTLDWLCRLNVAWIPGSNFGVRVKFT
jgi:hypothetical protein